MKWWACLGTGLIAGLAITLFWLVDRQNASVTRTDGPRGTVPRITLIDQLNRSVPLRAMGGIVLVANVITTSASPECPGSLGPMRLLQRRLQSNHSLAHGVQLISVTRDPLRDTPGVLGAYAQNVGADSGVWRFVTGQPEEVGRLLAVLAAGDQSPTPQSPDAGRSELGTYACPDEADFLSLIDGQGRIRARYNPQEFDEQRVLADITSLLR